MHAPYAAASNPTPCELARLGSWNESVALRLFAGCLACPTDGFCFLPGLALRRFFIRFAALHLAKDALALHLLLENPESLIHVVVANKYLQTFSDRVVAASCGVGAAVALMNLRALPTMFIRIYGVSIQAPVPTAAVGPAHSTADGMNEVLAIYKNFIASRTR